MSLYQAKNLNNDASSQIIRLNNDATNDILRNDFSAAIGKFSRALTISPAPDVVGITGLTGGAHFFVQSGDYGLAHQLP